MKDILARMKKLLDGIMPKDFVIPKGYIVGGVAFFFIFSFVLSSTKKAEREKVIVSSASLHQTESAKTEKGQGMFLSENIERKAYIERLEKQYNSVARDNEAITRKLGKLSGKLEDSARAVRKITAALSLMETKARKQALERKGGIASGNDGRPVDREGDYRLEIVNIENDDGVGGNDVYLPAGSFVSGTLLTGVYAPAGQGAGLPVLIRLTEAFIGPNESGISLEGAFVLGKATGDLNSERALIEAETIAAVFSSGETFEHGGGIGYVTDIQGQLGLKGVVVRNTGRQLAASFMTGFMGGVAQAVADGETASVSSDNGTVSRNVTGNAVKHAAFSGMAQSSAQLSRYYQDQLEAIVPAVMVRAGVSVHLILQKGFRVHGFPKEPVARFDHLD